MSFKEYLINNFENILAKYNFQNLEERRTTFKEFEKEGLPNLKNEDWKYTPINFLYNNDFELIANPQLDITSFTKKKSNSYIPENSNIFTFCNGIFAENESINLGDVKLEINDDIFNNISDNFPDGQMKASLKNDIFYKINQSLAPKSNKINIVSNSNPTTIILAASGETSNSFVNSKLHISVDKNVETSIFIYYLNTNQKKVFINQLLEFEIKENAQVKIYMIENDDNYLINNISLQQLKDSNLQFHIFSLRGNFIRNFIRNSLDATGIQSVIYGLYLPNGNDIIDNHILMTHNKPNCHSNQQLKGIMQDKSRGIFNGKILVQKDAQKTDAYQSNKNILVTKDASIYTKPALEIYADDVKCSHGATSGFLQEEELFYLTSRGIGVEESKSLLLKAFANEIIEKVTEENLKLWLQKEIEILI